VTAGNAVLPWVLGYLDNVTPIYWFFLPTLVKANTGKYRDVAAASLFVRALRKRT